MSHDNAPSSTEGDLSDPKSSLPDETLSVREKVGYGLGDTASNFYWKLFENFQLYFYTEVFGLAAGARLDVMVELVNGLPPG